MAIEIDNLVQHSYSFNKMVGVREIAETGSKEPADTSRHSVCIFKPWAVTSSSINDINIAHRVPVRNVTNGRKPLDHT